MPKKGDIVDGYGNKLGEWREHRDYEGEVASGIVRLIFGALIALIAGAVVVLFAGTRFAYERRKSLLVLLPLALILTWLKYRYYVDYVFEESNANGLKLGAVIGLYAAASAFYAICIADMEVAEIAWEVAAFVVVQSIASVSYIGQLLVPSLIVTWTISAAILAVLVAAWRTVRGRHTSVRQTSMVIVAIFVTIAGGFVAEQVSSAISEPTLMLEAILTTKESPTLARVMPAFLIALLLVAPLISLFSHLRRMVPTW